MAFYGKVYTFVKHENFDNFLKTFGIPDDRIQLLLSSKPTETLLKDGDTYSLITSSPAGDKKISFKSGVEFDEVILTEKVKSTYTVDGNTITQVLKGDKGSTTVKKVYNGDELVITATSDSFDGVAKRYYKA